MVSVVNPLTLPELAMIVVLPAATPVASPAVLMVATNVAAEFHVAELVRFCALPSLKVPVAVNCCVAPFAMEGLAGVTAIELNVCVEVPVPLGLEFDALLPHPDVTSAAPAIASRRKPKDRRI